MTRTSSWREVATPAALGAAACAACCAVPLVGLALGAGAASTVAAVAEPIAGLLLAVSLLVGGVVLVRRRRAAKAPAGSCGCGPAEASPTHA